MAHSVETFGDIWRQNDPNCAHVMCLELGFPCRVKWRYRIRYNPLSANMAISATRKWHYWDVGRIRNSRAKSDCRSVHFCEASGHIWIRNVAPCAQSTRRTSGDRVSPNVPPWCVGAPDFAAVKNRQYRKSRNPLNSEKTIFGENGFTVIRKKTEFGHIPFRMPCSQYQASGY